VATPEATRSILLLLGGETAIVPLENGMEAPETIAAIAGRERAARDRRVNRRAWSRPPPQRRSLRHVRRARQPAERAGYWSEESRGHVSLAKHNREYPPVKLGHHTEWFLVGTVTKIVEAPLRRS